ncbi:MAG TPA: heparan-alpha-glucosaminide N-acetyltransferase domain-containing protein [Halomicronema sp.]
MNLFLCWFMIHLATKPARLLSLDVFRGIAITAMILVNNPGSWDYIYPPLKHAKWHGCTPTDLIFPFFLFIVGVAMALSLSKYTPENRPTKIVYQRIIQRTLILFFLGLFLALLSLTLDALFNSKPFDISTLRIMGVLQRIALCYFFASLIVLNFSQKKQWLIAAIILIGYWLALQFIPVPGYGTGNLSANGESTLIAYLDRLILTPKHLLKPNPGFDPEGLLSTLPALVNVLIGYFTGSYLKQNTQPQNQTCIQLIITGLSCLIIGHLWSYLFPLNKQLWTSSYVLYTSGWALLLLAALYYIIEIRNARKWAKFFEIMGLNAIFLFVGSGIVARFLIKTHIGTGEKTATTYTWIYQNLFLPWAGPLNGSLLFALCTIIFWFIILYFMYQKKWFFKI